MDSSKKTISFSIISSAIFSEMILTALWILTFDVGFCSFLSDHWYTRIAAPSFFCLVYINVATAIRAKGDEDFYGRWLKNIAVLANSSTFKYPEMLIFLFPLLNGIFKIREYTLTPAKGALLLQGFTNLVCAVILFVSTPVSI